MTNAIRTVVKRVGQAPEVVNIGTDLKTWQAIVEGHCESILVGAENGLRVSIVCNEEAAANYNTHPEPRWKRNIPLSTNFIFPGGIVIRGPAFILKSDSDGNPVSLTELETRHWVVFLNTANTKLPTDAHSEVADPEIESKREPLEAVRQPYGGMTDMHQVMLLPDDQVDSDGHPMAPEQQIAGIAEQVGYRYKLVPTDNGDIYGVALTCLESQGLNYELEDESSMLLTLPADDGGRVRKYLRVIEIVGLDRAS